MFSTLIVSLLSIGAILGLNRAVDYIDNIRAKKDNITSDDVVKMTQKMINEARTKGNKTIDKLADRFSSIEIPFQAGTAVRSFLIDQKRIAKNKLEATKNKVANVETKLNTAEQRANFMASQPDAVRERMKDETENIYNDIVSAYNEMPGVETPLKGIPSEDAFSSKNNRTSPGGGGPSFGGR